MKTIAEKIEDLRIQGWQDANVAAVMMAPSSKEGPSQIQVILADGRIAEAFTNEEQAILE